MRSRVDHDVHGERGNVGRCDDTLDGKRSAELVAAVVEFIAQERCRQRLSTKPADQFDSDLVVAE